MPSPAGGPLQESVQSSKHITCCCSVSQSCPTLCSPMDCSTPGFPVHHKLISIESVMPNNHLIFCCPLLLLPLIFPSIRVFSDELALRIRWPPDLPLPLGVCVVAWPFWGMLSTLRWSPRDSDLSLPPNVPIISPGICRSSVHMGSTTSSDTSTPYFWLGLLTLHQRSDPLLLSISIFVSKLPNRWGYKLWVFMGIPPTFFSHIILEKECYLPLCHLANPPLQPTHSYP